MVLNHDWGDIKMTHVPFIFILSYMSCLYILDINPLLVISFADVISIYLYLSIYLSIYLSSTMEYYSAIKKNEILPFATTWMDLENIMLSEISQTEKDKYCMLPLICGI